MPGTPAEQTMDIPFSALEGHLQHGDTLGACQPPPVPPAGQETGGGVEPPE
jgi:hypothetical protein